MNVSDDGQLKNRVKILRTQHGWSQEELARRAGISRPAVSAIEIARLTPSIGTALALAHVFDCRVEDLFFNESTVLQERWAWSPRSDPSRYWRARVGDTVWLYPVEPTGMGVVPHDGIVSRGVSQALNAPAPENTLVIASCDPAAGLLASELARTSEVRLLVLARSSQGALELLRQRLVHLAGLHFSTPQQENGNSEAVRATLGSSYSLLCVAHWQEGLSLAAGVQCSSVRSILKSPLRWVGREPGSGARQCQDDLLCDRAPPRCCARDHRGVAEAIRCGWADVGVSVRLVAEEASLKFIGIREEVYQLCYATSLERDPRWQACLRVIRSRRYRELLSHLPGYDCRDLGDTIQVE